MTSALIGWSGFVGSTLLSQGFQPTARFRSHDMTAAQGARFDLVICAGAPAKKWWANQNNAEDRANLGRLITTLKTVECSRFVLISTIDVFRIPAGVDEQDVPGPQGLHPYGTNRLELEQFVVNRFAKHHVVRLCGLVGAGLKKNAVYDLAHRNQLEQLHPLARQQYYPMDRLSSDLRVVTKRELPLVHLVAEPIVLGEVAREHFGITLVHPGTPAPAPYDARSRYADLFGGQGGWQAPAVESTAAIRRYRDSISGTGR